MTHTLEFGSDSLSPRRQQSGFALARGFSFGNLDFTRIGAESGAIAINAAALLLLLAPMTAPFSPPTAQTETPIIIVEKPKIPPPLPPQQVRITPPRTVPVPVTRPAVASPRIELPPITLDESMAGDLPGIELPESGIGLPVAPPLTGAHLEYELAPAPPYPIEAIRNGLTGTVTLRVLVDVDGKPIDVQIEHSSGHRVLDAAARKHVLAKWRFKPARQDGQRVQAIGLVPIDFHLDR